MTAEPLLELTHVSKRFGARVALRDVSIDIAGGEVLAVLGANGAGKTTMLRTLATLARPTRGSVRAFGVDPWSAKSQVRARIGVVAHQPYVYPELTCAENLRFFASMFGLTDGPERADAVLDRVGLGHRADDRAQTLSRGLLQRLNLARAILHEPAVLILDEPDTGLDAPGRAVLTELVRSQADRGGSVVLTSHALQFALQLATRVAVVDEGRIGIDQPSGSVTDSEIEAVLSSPARA